MVGLLIESAEALGINHKNILFILSVDGVIPDPEPFGAGIDSGPYIKALTFVEYDSIE